MTWNVVCCATLDKCRALPFSVSPGQKFAGKWRQSAPRLPRTPSNPPPRHATECGWGGWRGRGGKVDPLTQLFLAAALFPFFRRPLLHRTSIHRSESMNLVLARKKTFLCETFFFTFYLGPSLGMFMEDITVRPTSSVQTSLPVFALRKI